MKKCNIGVEVYNNSTRNTEYVKELEVPDIFNVFDVCDLCDEKDPKKCAMCIVRNLQMDMYFH